MIEVEHTLEIARPADDVFSYITDVSRIPEWQQSAEEATLDGELREGARIREVRTFMGKRAVSTLEITELDPPSRFSLQVIEGPVKFAIEHALESVDGGTRVTFVGRGDTGRVPRLLVGTVKRTISREFVKDLEQLKRRLESR
jgi:uncharacterized protein YndB with AHSA1/START domain